MWILMSNFGLSLEILIPETPICIPGQKWGEVNGEDGGHDGVGRERR